MRGFLENILTPRSLLLISTLFSALGLVARAADEMPAASVPRPHILGISHAAFYVSDMAKARAFYEGFLGFASPFSIPRKDPTQQLVWIKINDHQTIELFPGSEVAADAPRVRTQKQHRARALPQAWAQVDEQSG